MRDGKQTKIAFSVPLGHEITKLVKLLLYNNYTDKVKKRVFVQTTKIYKNTPHYHKCHT